MVRNIYRQVSWMGVWFLDPWRQGGRGRQLQVAWRGGVTGRKNVSWPRQRVRAQPMSPWSTSSYQF